MRFLKANTLFNGKKTLSGDSVLVIDNNNLIKEIVSETVVEKSNIEQLNGILMPGFVNTHCHLELSHLKGQVPMHTGLPEFAKHIIITRNKFGKDEIEERAKAADAEMFKNGIVAVGDISNGSDSFTTKTQSPVFYHTFIELIGLNPASQTMIFDKGLETLELLKQKGLRGSLAPHAPYSTSTDLIKKIAEYDAGLSLPLTIHNQESEEETKFFNGQPSGFDDLYKFLGLDLSWYKAPNQSSLQSYVDQLSATQPSVLVHNTFTQPQDILAAKSKAVYWCFCPGANAYIENGLPDFSRFVNHTHAICFGTDSLASNTQLDVLQEANLVLKQSPVFTPEIILQALTSNAAEALGIADKFGSFIPGKNAGLNLVEFKNSQLQLIKKIL